MSITNEKSTLFFPYSINGRILQNVSQFKYLGVLISCDLSWNAHVSQIYKKALNKLLFLKRSLTSSTYETLLLAYTSLIQPILEYAIVALRGFRTLKAIFLPLKEYKRKLCGLFLIVTGVQIPQPNCCNSLVSQLCLAEPKCAG